MLEVYRIQISEGEEDEQLRLTIEQYISMLEHEKMSNPFIQPSYDSDLDKGDIEIIGTDSGLPIKVSYCDSSPNRIYHGIVNGKTGSGKTHFLANIASCASNSCYTLILDSAQQFRKFPEVRRTHNIVRADDLRINLWDGIDGLSPHVSDQIINHELCSSFGVQYGELEIGEETSEQRAQGEKPNLESITNGLKKKQKGNRFSRRFYYRDSALLMQGNLSRSCPMYNCAKGMDIEKALFKGNVVVECENMLPAFQRFFVRFIFEYMGMLALAGKHFDRPLIFLLDEGQYIVSG